jgi:3'-phosphoadenosine 5'-phosphosulfate sulfotransferase (PAPS reductase)/FAD synthetase
MARTVVWFSCGAASAIAANLTLQETPDAVLAYCETGGEHPDNARFMADCEKWLGTSVERLRSDEYTDTWDVWTRKRYLAGIAGAPCTTELKVGPRLRWQKPDDIHVFGYTYDKPDQKRAVLLRDNYPEMSIRTPLIDSKLNKQGCLALLQRAGITVPPMYALGFHNNNCIPCVKSQSPAYWALVRKQFPEQFTRMVNLSRELNVRLIKMTVNGVRSRYFIDEIPLDQDTTNPIAPACDFLCSKIAKDFEE